MKSSKNFTIRKDLIDTLENLNLGIQKPSCKPFVVVTWYRPPGSPIGIFSPFKTLIGKLDSENIEHYLMGDFNCDMIATRYANGTRKLMSITDIEHYLMGDFNCDMIATRYDNDTRKLMSITDIYGLQQLITEPTRITPTSATLIGVIFTNFPDRIVCSGVRHIKY